MAESLGAAVLTVSVDDQQFQAGLNSARSKAQQASGQISQSFNGIANSLRALAGVAGIVGIGALTQQIIATGQQAQRAEIQLRSLAGAYNEANQAAAATARIQKVLGISSVDAQQGFSQLYAALRGSGIGLQQLEVLFVGISNAARLSGASTQEASSALLQLKQGLASGTLQGDELRSVLESLPALTNAIAKQLGVSQGQVRQLGSEGKITAEVVFNAAKQLASATVPGRTELEQLGIAFENVKAQAAAAFGPALVSVLNTAAASLGAFKSFLQDNREAFVNLGRSVVEIGKTLAPLVLGIMAVRAAMNAWAIASKGVAVAQAAVLALSGPKGWALLAVGVAASGVAMVGLEKALKGVQGATGKAKAEAAKAVAEFQKLLNSTELKPQVTAAAPQLSATGQTQAALEAEGMAMQIAYAKQLATLEGSALLQLQQRLAVEEKIRAAKAAQNALNKELAKAANQRSSERIDDLLLAVQKANGEVRLAYAEAGASLVKNAKTAAEAFKSAQAGFNATARGGFEFLTPRLQRQQLDQARASIQPLVDRGVIRQGLNIATPDRLFALASFAESFNSAEKELVKAQRDNTAAIEALSTKNWNVQVVVAGDGSTKAYGDALNGAIS